MSNSAGERFLKNGIYLPLFLFKLLDGRMRRVTCNPCFTRPYLLMQGSYRFGLRLSRHDKVVARKRPDDGPTERNAMGKLDSAGRVEGISRWRCRHSSGVDHDRRVFKNHRSCVESRRRQNMRTAAETLVAVGARVLRMIALVRRYESLLTEVL